MFHASSPSRSAVIGMEEACRKRPSSSVRHRTHPLRRSGISFSLSERPTLPQAAPRQRSEDLRCAPRGFYGGRLSSGSSRHAIALAQNLLRVAMSFHLDETRWRLVTAKSRFREGTHATLVRCPSHVVFHAERVYGVRRVGHATVGRDRRPLSALSCQCGGGCTIPF